MGIPVLVLGESGTGKSASLRNCEAAKVKVINVANKPLPFKNKIECVATDDYRTVIKELKMTKKPIAVIDDAQYLMANEFMRRATERGFDKFTEIAQNFWNLVNTVKELPNDHIVYFLAHIERDQNGNEKIKTIGKLLDEKITVEGMFTIVLKTNVTDGQYSFLTQNSGHDTVKSPIGMFPSYAIDNDLNYVDEKIRNYYEIGEFLTDEEMAEIDEAAKKDDIPIADEKPKKRGRRSAKKEEPENTSQEEKEEATEKPKRRRKVTEEATDNDGEPDTDGTSDAEDKKPTRRRRTREEVEHANDLAVAEANTTDDGEPIDMTETEVDMPEPETVPRKTRKKREEEPVEETEETPATPARRRRRRA